MPTYADVCIARFAAAAVRGDSLEAQAHRHSIGVSRNWKDAEISESVLDDKSCAWMRYDVCGRLLTYADVC